MRRNRLTILAIFVLFLVAVAVVAVQTAEEPGRPRLLATSSQADGARALNLWLRRLAFDVSTQRIADYAPPDDASVVLMLAPSFDVSLAAVDRLDTWMREGNMLLVAAAGGLRIQPLLERYELTLTPRFGDARNLVAASPLIGGPLAWEAAELAPDFTISTDRRDVVTLLRYDDEPVIVLLPLDDGYLVLSTVWEPFSNSGLRKPGYAALALNLITLGDAARNGTIWFDDWHHGVQAGAYEFSGPAQWLRQTAPGRATLFAGFTLLALLVWRGRRFGRPRPLPQTLTRRAPLEYVTAIANLNRRANNRAAVLADYRRRLKRQIGRRYRISAQLADEAFVEQLRLVDPAFDSAALSNLLQRLDRPRASESEMVGLAVEVDQMLNPRPTASSD